MVDSKMLLRSFAKKASIIIYLCTMVRYGISAKYLCGCMFSTGCLIGGNSCCAGLVCQYIDAAGSTQCLENPIYSSKKNCVQTNQNGCAANSDCCNSAASCSRYNNCILEYNCTYRYTSPDPTGLPTHNPTTQPIKRPSRQPSSQPRSYPSKQPFASPSKQPSRQPLRLPSRQPSRQPNPKPLASPTTQPTKLPQGKPSKQPSRNPSHQPSKQPRRSPSAQPSRQPRGKPSSQPIKRPTRQPSSQPLRHPIANPSVQPSQSPSTQPVGLPSTSPSCQPTGSPSQQPKRFPSAQPSLQPFQKPIAGPSTAPTQQPIIKTPSRQPSAEPTFYPTMKPSHHPSRQPSDQPSVQPQQSPTSQPTIQPTRLPTSQSSAQPSRNPTRQPSKQPLNKPSLQPFCIPSVAPSIKPSRQPISMPSLHPSCQPSSNPIVIPTLIPTKQPLTTPTLQPSNGPSTIPTTTPLSHPTALPTEKPIVVPTKQPVELPSTRPSLQPTQIPTNQPLSHPSGPPVGYPSGQPTGAPTSAPFVFPRSLPTALPSLKPSSQPQLVPSAKPTQFPSIRPASKPSSAPSGQPMFLPSGMPSVQPIPIPSNQPVHLPSTQPSSMPVGSPSEAPTATPSYQPSCQPSRFPISFPSKSPSVDPTSFPTLAPTSWPSISPFESPTEMPSMQPTSLPTDTPFNLPTTQPTLRPSEQPNEVPSSRPSDAPYPLPTVNPSSRPSAQPQTQQPSRQPFTTPSSQPSLQPADHPSHEPFQIPSYAPTLFPSYQPSSSPTAQPNTHPSRGPLVKPTGHPVARPTFQPMTHPTSKPSAKPIQFEASVMVINMTIPFLDASYKFALVKAIASSMGVATSDVTFLDATHSSRRFLTVGIVEVCRLAVNIPSSEFPQFKDNATSITLYVQAQLRDAVYSGKSTAWFRQNLNDLGVPDYGFPAIIAVDFNGLLSFPTVAPSRGPDYSNGVASTSFVNKALLLGLVGAVFGFMCIFMPILFLVRNAVNKKFKVVGADAIITLEKANQEYIENQRNRSVTEEKSVKSYLKHGSPFILSRPHRITPQGFALPEKARSIDSSKHSQVRSLDFSYFHLLYQNEHCGEDFDESMANVNLEDTFNVDGDFAFSSKSLSPINKSEKDRQHFADSDTMSMLNSMRLEPRTAIYKETKVLEKSSKYNFFGSFNSSQTAEDRQMIDLPDFYPTAEQFKTEVAASLSSMSTSLAEKSLMVRKGDPSKVFSDDSSCDGYSAIYSNPSLYRVDGIATPPIPLDSPYIARQEVREIDSKMVEARIRSLQKGAKYDTPFNSPIPSRQVQDSGLSPATIRMEKIYPNSEDETFQSSKIIPNLANTDTVMKMSDVYPEENGVESAATLDVIRLEFPTVDLQNTFGASTGVNSSSSRPPSPMLRGSGRLWPSMEGQPLPSGVQDFGSMNSPSSPLPQLRSMKPRNMLSRPTYIHAPPSPKPRTQASPGRRGSFDSQENSIMSSPRQTPPKPIAPQNDNQEDFYSPIGSQKLRNSRLRGTEQVEFPQDDFSSPQSVKFKAIRTKFETMIQKNTNANRTPKLSKVGSLLT